MKKHISITVFIAMLIGLVSHSQDMAGKNCIKISTNPNWNASVQDTNVAIFDSILAINLAAYIGEPVDSLLSKLPTTFHTLRITSGDRPHLAERLIITYQNWYWIQVVVQNFQFMSQYDPQRLWDLTLFKKETISWIFVDRGNTCVYGCEGSQYHN